MEKTVYDGKHLKVEQTEHNAMYILSYMTENGLETYGPVMTETLSEALWPFIDPDNNENDHISSDSKDEMFDLYSDVEAALTESGYYEEGM